MPTVLAIDTSAKPVSCAVMQDDRLLASYYAHTNATHSQTLLPMIEHTLQMCGLIMKDIDALAVNNGPGSFTGVRIGVSAVKGIAFAEEKPCIPVSTLSSMAESFRGLPMNVILCCSMDARCQQVYTALFSLNANGEVERMTEDEALSLTDLKERLSAYDKPILYVGDGASICQAAFAADLPNGSLAPIALRFQSAVGVAAAAMHTLQNDETVSAAELLPSYLRLPQAERELRSRQGLV